MLITAVKKDYSHIIAIENIPALGLCCGLMMIRKMGRNM